MAAPLQNKRRDLGKLFAGLVDSPVAATHEARENQRLRFGPAFCEALLDQKLVGSALRTQSRRNYARAGCAAISRPSADKAIAAMCRALSPAWSYCACGES